MALIEIDHNPTDRQLRWFGLLLGAFFLLLAAIANWRFQSPQVARFLLMVAVLVPTVYYLAPQVRKPLYVGWMYAVYPLGVMISYVILAAIYYLLVTPLGILLRVSGRDLLERRIDKCSESYWVSHAFISDPRRYFRQF